GWRHRACPVNGPALAARGRSLALAWYTGAGGPRVSIAFSGDGGATFGRPVRVDGGRPLGRVDVEWADAAGREAVVVWMEEAGSGAAVRARRVRTDGAVGAPLTLAHADRGAAGGFPRIVVTGSELVYAWTAADGGGVRAAALPLDRLGVP
ncbi:MAG TPA: hypothetical protein VNK43_07710, partial [Gemmatimonadales bacterium]|nr:hypothetical protein [Gemmatimonadales bacterium]